MTTTQQVIADKIQEVAFTKVGLNDELFKSGILSSIIVIDLATSLEEEFNIQIPFNEISIENFSTVELIDNFIKTKQ
ncbi:MAG: D-alanyl carrier protein [Sphingobacteriaceae bacterium]|jgi:D-alanine--poly(phosphoribitol) ligase subunit 2|nr:D-alanyl carrier protein [Sphingobacteriaceae bacterium]